MNNKCYIYGGLLADCYYEVSRWPQRSQDGLILGEQVMAGGCAVNMAATIKNLGGEPLVISAMGDDAQAQFLLNYMEQKGFSTEFLWPAGGTSGKCMVFLEPDGERTFLTGKGAETVYPRELDQKIRREVPGAVGITGYYLLNSSACAVLDTVEYFASCGSKVLFDPSPLVSSIADDILQRVLDISHIMTPNTTELSYIEGFVSVDAYVAGGRTAVVKSGSSGGTVFTPSGKFDYSAAPVRTVKDTTGAGDSFAGALLYSMVQGLPVREAVELAAVCAAKTVEIQGPHGFWSLSD
ncbi:MAG: carbohydrate kinase family protein [Anaerovoracaceae bacterium]